MKSTEDLIETLIKSNKKVTRDFSPIQRTLITICSLIIMAFTALYLSNPYSYEIKNLSHGLEVISLIVLIYALVYLGFKSFVPGENKRNALILVSISFLFVFITFSYRFINPQTYNKVRQLCEVEAISLSLITTVLGHFLLKRNEYARHNIYSYVLFLALPAIGTLFMHGVCSISFIHVLICHLISPLLIPGFYILFTFYSRRS